MWARFLNSRWCIPFAALIGMLLTAPTINMGLMGDDYLHWSLLTGLNTNHQPGAIYGLFTFANGDPHVNQTMMDSGKLIWWASENLRISFWRPLAELSQRLDYILWPDSPVMMHLHNLLLYGLMILLIGKLFLELDQNKQQAGLATLLFAGNMLHVFAVAWLASRNQMLCGVLMALTLLSYHRWRQGASTLYGLGAFVCLSLGLLSAEAAVQTMGYLLAYSLFLDNDRPWLDRAKALIPFVVLVLVWKVTHGHLGYGSFGSPGYVDPSSNASRFAGLLILRLPVLMAAQWLGISSMMFEQLDQVTQYAYAGGAITLLFGLAYVIYRLGGFKTALGRFYAMGSIVSLIPACAGYTFDRLTVNSDIGASGMLAMLAMLVWHQRVTLKGGSLPIVKWAAYIVSFIHLLAFPVGKIASSIMMKPLTRAGEDLTALALPDASQASSEDFILINPPSAESVYYFPLIRQHHGRVNPTTMRALGPNNQAMTLSRVDAQSLRLVVPSGHKGSIARDIRLQPIKAGDTMRMGNISVTVESVTNEQAPRSVLFRFPDSLESSHWRYFSWAQDGVHALKPPAIGQSVEIASYDISKAVMDYVNGKK